MGPSKYLNSESAADDATEAPNEGRYPKRYCLTARGGHADSTKEPCTQNREVHTSTSPPPLDNPYLELSLLSLTKSLLVRVAEASVRDAADIGVNYGLEFEGSAGRRAATASRC